MRRQLALAGLVGLVLLAAMPAEALAQNPDMQKWFPVVEECIESETLQLMEKLPV